MSNVGASNSANPPAAAKPQRKARPRPSIKTRKLPPYNVVLLNDDDHTYQYVIEMLAKVFGHPQPKAYKMAREVDSTGRVIVFTAHKELAELKRDQIHAYGPDVLIAHCRGSMSARIEPAPAP